MTWTEAIKLAGILAPLLGGMLYAYVRLWGDKQWTSKEEHSASMKELHRKLDGLTTLITNTQEIANRADHRSERNTERIGEQWERIATEVVAKMEKFGDRLDSLGENITRTATSMEHVVARLERLEDQR